MKTKTKSIGLILFLLALNLSLIYITLGASAHIIQVEAAERLFLLGGVLGLLGCSWLGFRIRKKEMRVFYKEGLIIYPVSICLSILSAFYLAYCFKTCAPEGGPLFALVLVNGFFVSFGIAIKLNDLKYAMH